MSDIDLHQICAGREFYDKTMPELVERLRRLADAAGKLVPREDEDSRRCSTCRRR